MDEDEDYQVRRKLPDLDEDGPGCYLPSALLVSLYDKLAYPTIREGRESSVLIADDAMSIIESDITRIDDESTDEDTHKIIYLGHASTTDHTMTKRRI